MHHIPEYHDDPYQFKPSRFDPDQKRYDAVYIAYKYDNLFRPSPYVYMPFGFGYRTCIGKQFAMVRKIDKK